MIERAQNKVDQRLCCDINQCKIKGTFDIGNSISGHITSVQLMDTIDNVNHAVSISENLAFYSNK